MADKYMIAWYEQELIDRFILFFQFRCIWKDTYQKARNMYSH